MQKKHSSRQLMYMALLSGMSFLLLFFEVPILPLFDFLKLDISELPVLLATLLMGPLSGTGVAFIRSLLHFIFQGGNVLALIGDTAGWIASMCYLWPVYLWTKHKQLTITRLLSGLMLSTFVMTLVLSLLNLWIILPLYLKVLDFGFGMPVSQVVLWGILPFNLIKGLVLAILFTILLKALTPWLTQRNWPHLVSLNEGEDE